MDLSMRRLTAVAGPVGVGIALASILGAVALAPWFTWTGNALSDLGSPARSTALLFNTGLVLSGALGVAFTGRLYDDATNAAQRAGIGVLALSFLSLSLVGVFPTGHAYHTPAAVAFFVGFTLALFLFSSGDAIARLPRRSVVTTWFGVAHVTAWYVWQATDYVGVAIPEFLGALLLSVWVLVHYRDLGPKTWG